MRVPKKIESYSLVIRDNYHFPVFTYLPIHLQNEEGEQHIVVNNPEHVQVPLLKNIMAHLDGSDICTCDSVSATPTNWAIDRILGKF